MTVTAARRRLRRRRRRGRRDHWRRSRSRRRSRLTLEWMPSGSPPRPCRLPRRGVHRLELPGHARGGGRTAGRDRRRRARACWCRWCGRRSRTGRRLAAGRALTGPVARGDRADGRRAARGGRRASAGAAGTVRRVGRGDARAGVQHGAGWSTHENAAHGRRAATPRLPQPRRAGRRIGLVPTMGALHDGHLSLMRRARSECDVVVVSLFVNPTQFNEGADLAAYPRDEARDAMLAADERVDFLFAPSVEEIYPDGFATTVSVSGLTEMLEGASARPRPLRRRHDRCHQAVQHRRRRTSPTSARRTLSRRSSSGGSSAT